MPCCIPSTVRIPVLSMEWPYSPTRGRFGSDVLNATSGAGRLLVESLNQVTSTKAGVLSAQQ